MGRRRRQTHENPKEDEVCRTPISEYGQSREERIRENLEKMKKLGIFELSFGLKLNNNTPLQPRRLSNDNDNNKTPPSRSPLQSFSEPTRRSSRLKNASPVTYSELELSKKNKVALIDDEGFLGEEGSRPRRDGLCSWTVTGAMERESMTKSRERLVINADFISVMHEGCTNNISFRQKTLGYRTRCCECDMVQGQFCGDCLYMRYGEHVLEAMENPNWICPVCRGICNCSLCRQAKGWAPTGPLYKKITRLGFKSVAHYLIQTRRSEANLVTNDSANSVIRSLAFSYVGVQPGPSAQLEDKSDDKNSSEQPLLLLAMKPAFESIASQKEVSEIEFAEKEEQETGQEIGTPKLNQTSPATIAINSDSIAGRSKARHRKGNAHDDNIPDDELAVKKVISSQSKVEKQREPVQSDIIEYHGDDNTPLKTTPKLKKKLTLADVPSLDSITGRLRSSRKVSNDEQAGNGVLSENGTEEKTEEAVPSDIEHRSDENNPKTTPNDEQAGNGVLSENGTEEKTEEAVPSDIEHRSDENNPKTTPKPSLKRSLVVVPSSDSIGGRLRQRRKISNVNRVEQGILSENEMEDQKEEQPSDRENLCVDNTPPKTPTPKLNQKRALVVIPSSDSIAGRLRQRRKISDADQAEQKEALRSDIKLCGDADTPVKSSTKLKAKLALAIVPSSDSIGGRLRQRLKTSDNNLAVQEELPSNVRFLSYTNTPLQMVPSSDSIGGRLRLRRKVSSENNDAEKLKEADIDDVGCGNSPLKRTPKRNQKLALVAPASPDSIGGRLRLRRAMGDGSDRDSDSKRAANGKSA